MLVAVLQLCNPMGSCTPVYGALWQLFATFKQLIGRSPAYFGRSGARW